MKQGARLINAKKIKLFLTDSTLRLYYKYQPANGV
jgi:hypothetical protein